jgi:hypothetical protein
MYGECALIVVGLRGECLLQAAIRRRLPKIARDRPLPDQQRTTVDFDGNRILAASL